MGAPHPLLLPLIRGDDLPADIDISHDLVASAEEHLVAALVDEAVTARAIDVDPEIRKRLTASTLGIEAESRTAEKAATQLMDVADGLGIRLGIFKGIAIGNRFYSHPHLRPTIDIDAFVAPAHLGRLGELCRALGASSEDSEAINAMVLDRRVFEAEFPIGGTVADLHRDPMNLIVISADEHERWDRTVDIPLTTGRSIRTLDLEDTTIQALLNLFRDNFADLLHINDVRLMMDADPNWDEVARRAELNGWTALVRFGAWFVSDQLGRPSPLPTHLPRWQKQLIDGIWPRDLLLHGAESHAQSLRRQSAAGLLVSGRPGRTSTAYLQRLLPRRSVIDQRSETTGGPYPVALIRWRMEQRREAAAFRQASYGDER